MQNSQRHELKFWNVSVKEVGKIKSNPFKNNVYVHIYLYVATDKGHYSRLSRFSGDLSNCSELIRETKNLLRAENLSYSCSALEEIDCDLTYQMIYSRSRPESVFSRSQSCDLEWPEYREISSEETDFPLACFLMVYTDARMWSSPWPLYSGLTTATVSI